MDFRRGKFGYNLIRIGSIKIFWNQKNNFGSLTTSQRPNETRLLLRPFGPQQLLLATQNRRTYGMILFRAARGLLKVRYLLLGGAISGGVTLQNKYEAFRASLPDMSWIRDIMPDSELKFANLSKLRQQFEEIEFGDKFSEWRHEFNRRLDKAIAVTDKTSDWTENGAVGRGNVVGGSGGGVPESLAAELPSGKGAEKFTSVSADESRADKTRIQELEMENRQYKSQIAKLNKEMLQFRRMNERKIRDLEAINERLQREQSLYERTLSGANSEPKTLVEKYSQILDDFARYANRSDGYEHQLPQVVVVGPQSAGKTSVLEMIANGRLFPRGAGEMMTRAPVQVTLAHDQRAVAKFNNADREYNLRDEQQLSELRKELERRMSNSVRNLKGVSQDVISMSVRGPQLQPMVLVDLPGTIVSQSAQMVQNTKLDIDNMVKKYMSNPNAIILCIQDGSADVEHSSITSLVSEIDPEGKRTIFVLTKADVAEKNNIKADIIKDILSGKRFQMKAMGYFAVVTGRGGDVNDSIAQIKQYEKDFFESSKLFGSEKIGNEVTSMQMTTTNLSEAVSRCFWEMVRSKIEQQKTRFSNLRIELENEWKTKFPNSQKLDRESLFSIANNQIIENVACLSNIPANQWEKMLEESLMSRVATFLFNEVFEPTLHDYDYYFNKIATKRLRENYDRIMQLSIECGTKVLETNLKNALFENEKKIENEQQFDKLKTEIFEQICKIHQWDQEDKQEIGIFQRRFLEDNFVATKNEWYDAADFFKNAIENEKTRLQRTFHELCGPSITERWTKWCSKTTEQQVNCRIKNELMNLLQQKQSLEQKSQSQLDALTLQTECLMETRSSLKRSGIEVEVDQIQAIWKPVYKQFLLQKALERLFDGRKMFDKQNEPDLAAERKINEIKLFGMFKKTLQQTTIILRNQIMNLNGEVSRIESQTRKILKAIGADDDKKCELINDERIRLFEELEGIRNTEEKIKEFIESLNSEHFE